MNRIEKYRIKMKGFNNHIILSLIAIIATNTFFIISWLIDASSTFQLSIQDLSFDEFVVITNGTMIIISLFTITYKNLGDSILKWGYSNLFRGFILIVLSVIVFVLASMLLFCIHFVINESPNISLALLSILKDSYFDSLVFFYTLVSTLMFFISNLERRSGNVFRLIAQSMGNSLKPKLVQHGFMFIDLNDATSLAESLDGQKYANLLRDCFRLLNELIELSPFEVYQYVGDEAVITWKTDIPNADLKAIQLFTDFKAYLEENKFAFAKAYQVQPKFKCAIHSGEVVQSEIGKEVKHLVYHGDVLNTASRLLSQCHFFNTDCIISKAALTNASRTKEHFTLELLSNNKLKGKQHLVDVFKIEPKTESHHFHINNASFFFNPKVTISHY